MLNLTPLSASEASALAAGLTKAQRRLLGALSKRPKTGSAILRDAKLNVWPHPCRSFFDFANRPEGRTKCPRFVISETGLAVRALLREQGK